MITLGGDKRGKIYGALGILSLAFFSYLMILITAQYIPMKEDVAFLALKDSEMELPYYPPAFFTHVYTSIFTLLLGFVQFSGGLRRRFPKIHRNAGKAYVLIILFAAGPSGLIMGVHANGGIYSQISFVMLAVLWMYFTYRAWATARAKNWTAHRNFMYRSYALTLSAISLRLFKWIMVSTLSTAPMDTYKVVAWAGWVVNLIIAEGLIYRQKNDKTMTTKKLVSN
jgi:uncharacterized membrane protein